MRRPPAEPVDGGRGWVERCPAHPSHNSLGTGGGEFAGGLFGLALRALFGLVRRVLVRFERAARRSAFGWVTVRRGGRGGGLGSRGGGAAGGRAEHRRADGAAGEQRAGDRRGG